METALQQKSCCLHSLLSPRIIFAHRIQSTAGRIWPLIERFDCCATVPCDSALIRWQIDVPSKIQDFAEFGSGIHLFVKVPDRCTRIKDHLQAEGNECSITYDEEQLCPLDSLSISARDKVCASERAEASAGTYFHVTHLKLSSWLSAFWLLRPLKPKGSAEQISPFVFVGSCESFIFQKLLFPCWWI